MTGPALSSAPSIVFRADASANLGGGHIMRCLSLASALAERGARITFVSAMLTESLRAAIEAEGHRVQRIEPSPELLRRDAGFDLGILSEQAQAEDADHTRAAAGDADWLVIDHYRLDAAWSGHFRPAGATLVIDDLADRRHSCDLIVDQTYGRSPADYAPLVEKGTRILAGAAFAMLRPEFAEARQETLARRESTDPARRLLISLGMTDVGGITEHVLDSILDHSVDLDVDVVLGAAAPSRAAVDALVAKDPRITLHVDSRDMVGLIARADIAVGAAGSSAWERCCLGLPTVTLVLADNQRLVAANLERAGAIAIAPDAAAVGACVERLRRDTRSRMAMIAAAAAIIDGRGAVRVAETMLGTAGQGLPDLRVRPASAQDSRAVWSWRNDPGTRAASQTHDPVPWPDHAGWWNGLLSATDRHVFMVEVAGEPVTVVRFDRYDWPERAYEVSINVRPGARGGGLGARALASACREFLAREGDVTLIATIHRDNQASRRIFERIGFIRQSEVGQAGFERYLRPGGAGIAS